MSLRSIGEGLAEYIMQDKVLHDDGKVTVLVEDKANVWFEAANALSVAGVTVLIAMREFRRQPNSPILQGTLSIDISCMENPELNRDDSATLTAQAVMERIAQILHYARLPCLSNVILFDNFSRQDEEDTNIVRGAFTTNTVLK